MKNFYITYTFKSKQDRDNFLKEVKIPAEITRKEKGCVRYDYFYPVDSDNALFLWEQWETGKDQEVHTEQPHFVTIVELKEKYSAETEISF